MHTTTLNVISVGLSAFVAGFSFAHEKKMSDPLFCPDIRLLYPSCPKCCISCHNEEDAFEEDLIPSSPIGDIQTKHGTAYVCCPLMEFLREINAQEETSNP